MHCIKFTRLIALSKGTTIISSSLEVYDFAVGLICSCSYCANVHRDISFTELLFRNKGHPLLRC